MIANRPLSAAELTQFHQHAISAFDAAADRLGTQGSTLRIGPATIELVTAGEPLHALFLPALRGIIDRAGGSPPARLMVFDSKASGIPVPVVPRPIKSLIDWRGECWKENNAKGYLLFNMGDYTLTSYDPVERSCVVVISDAARLPGWSLAAPLRPALGLMLQGQGVQLVHGAAVGGAEGALLITGHGGSGKSTTALSCLRAGLAIAGDDYVAISRCGDGPPRVHNVYSSIKLLPHEMDGPPPGDLTGGKAILYPFERDEHLLTRDAPLLGAARARIVDDEATRIVPANAYDVARIAYASTALQIVGDQTIARSTIETIIDEAAAFELRLGRNRMNVADAIAAFLETPAKPLLSIAPRASMTGLSLSVVIPIFNGAHFVGEAIRSIAAQGHDEVEIILVDDGAGDALDRALEGVDAEYTLIRQANAGAAAARNRGIRAAQGELIAFLDVDDRWSADFFSLLSRELALHPEAGFVMGKTISFQDGAEPGRTEHVHHPRENFPMFIGSGLYRREIFDKVGLYDESLRFGEDIEWFLRARDHGPVLQIPETVLELRMHDDNMTADLDGSKRGTVRALKQHLERRRTEAEA